MKIKRFILSFLFSLWSLSQFWEGKKQKHTWRLPIVSSVCRHGGARGQAGEGAGGARRQAGGGRRGLGRAALRELQRRGHRERQRGGRLSFREVRGRAQTPASRHHQPPAARQDSCSWKQFAAANSPINRLARGWAGLAGTPRSRAADKHFVILNILHVRNSVLQFWHPHTLTFIIFREVLTLNLSWWAWGLVIRDPLPLYNIFLKSDSASIVALNRGKVKVHTLFEDINVDWGQNRRTLDRNTQIINNNSPPMLRLITKC